MINHQSKFSWLLSLVALLFVIEDISAQMDVRVLGNASNCYTCKNRTEFWVGVYHNSGGGADAEGYNESSWEVCGDQANSGWGPTLYCPGGVVRVQGHTAGRNRTLG